MKNKAVKNLIILGTIIFSFNFANEAFASCVGYDCNYNSGYRTTTSRYNNNRYYRNSGYDSDRYYNNRVSGYETNTPTVVNNYYYDTNSVSSNTTKTSTKETTVAKTTSDDTSTSNNNSELGILDSSSVRSNLLGASAANGLTALSLRGSGGFMPSSIWQWILVVIFILIIIILIRKLMYPNKENTDPHVGGAHH